MTPEDQLILEAILRHPTYKKPLRFYFENCTIDTKKLMEIMWEVTNAGRAEAWFNKCFFTYSEPSVNCAPLKPVDVLEGLSLDPS